MPLDGQGTFVRRNLTLIPEYRGWKLFTPGVTALIVLHTVGFLILVLPEKEAAEDILLFLSLDYASVFARLHLWQLVTHSFLYPSMCAVWGLIWMGLLLLFFGSGLEREWGTKRFIAFYVVMAVASGLVRMLPDIGSNLVLGSLGVFCAVLAAFGFVFRHERLWLVFVNARVPNVVIGMLVIIALLNIKPIENLLWLSGAAFGLLYPRLFLALGRRRPRAVPQESDRFSQIDVDD